MNTVRNFLFTFLFLFCGSAMADSYFGQYWGPLFPEDKGASCLLAYQDVEQAMASYDIDVFSGGCKQHDSGQWEVWAQYSYSFMDQLDQFSYPAQDEASCAAKANVTANSLKSKGYRMIHHYCSKGRMIFDFVKNWEEKIDSTKFLAAYADELTCQEKVNSLLVQLRGVDVTNVLGLCRRFMSEEGERYSPEAIYSIDLDSRLELSFGGSFGECRLDTLALKENFAAAGRSLLFAKCLPTLGGKKREVLMYKVSLRQWERSYVGKAKHESAEACYEALAESAGRLQLNGEVVLYPRCIKHGDDYVEKILFIGADASEN